MSKKGKKKAARAARKAAESKRLDAVMDKAMALAYGDELEEFSRRHGVEVYTVLFAGGKGAVAFNHDDVVRAARVLNSEVDMLLREAGKRLVVREPYAEGRVGAA